jgi:hypothetical protein
MRKDRIDKDSIFNLFEDNTSQEEVIATRKSLDDFIKSPFAKIGMFTKLILNHFVFHQKLQKFLKKEEPSYNSESTREAADFTIFNRSWHYIKNIDIENPEHIDAILNFNPKIFNKALQSSIMYFEACEQYERCAHLLNIQQIVKRL